MLKKILSIILVLSFIAFPAHAERTSPTLPDQTGNSGKVLTTNGSGGLSWVSMGGGSIGGSTGATDNAILRADGTGGATLQNSGVIVEDNNGITSSISSGNGLVFSGATTGNLIKLTPSGNTGQTSGTSGSLLINATSNPDGFSAQFYTNSGAESDSPMLLVKSDNTANNQPLSWFIQDGTGGYTPFIRADGPSPQLEMYETDQTGTDGQFEMQVQGNILFFNSRNLADTSFENIVWILQAKSGFDGHVGIGVNPYNIEKLTIGETTGGAARIAIKETTAPTSDSGYGKIWSSSTDSMLHFMDDSGNDYNIPHGLYSSADYTIDASGGTYTKASTALAATPSNGGTYHQRDGTITETTQISITRSATELHLSNGATITNNGATLTTLIAPSTTGFGRFIMSGGKLLQSNATEQGTAIDMSDMANSWVSNMRIEGYGIGIKMDDTVDTTFYNHVQNIQMFNVLNGIHTDGQSNLNLWTNVRIRPKNLGAGLTYGVDINNTRGNVFNMLNVEPPIAADIIGLHLNSTSRDNLFLGVWLENNDGNLQIDSGASNNIFIGGTITGAASFDIDDSGTDTTFIGTNVSGTKLFRIPRITGLLGDDILKFVSANSATSNQITIENAASTFTPIISATGVDSNIDLKIIAKGTGQIKFASTVSPFTSDGAALGTTSLMWSDLFLASGSVINFNNGDATITHSADLLAIAGATLRTNDIQLTTGSGIRTGTTAGNTFLLQARDVDGAAYTTFATMTANNTPTFDIAPTSITTTNITGGQIIAGVWTPTLTNVANLDGSTAFECQYSRNGATVTGSCRVSINPTLTTTSTQLGITIPVASNFGAIEDAAGACFATGIASQGAGIIADTTNDRLQMQFISGDVTDQPMTCAFSYQVI